MAIDKKFIHAKTLAEFKKELNAGNIKDTSIVFIKDALQIWTHGQYYSFSDAPADGNSYVRKNNGWVIGGDTSELMETVLLTLTSNKNNSDIIGATITVTYPGVEKIYTWNGDTITILIPTGVTYTISFGEIPNYGTPILKTITTSAGYIRLLNVLYTYVTYISQFDIYGNAKSENTTANCYVVKNVGYYKIPLVYGNAIVNNSTNSAAYTLTHTLYSTSYVNGNNTTINTPFIEQQVTISSALLSITDTDGVFSDITVSSNPNVTSINNCGYVLFKVNSIPDTGANGVISVKNSNGKIIWNWHIWVWTDDLTPVSITNSNRVIYKILPYNLASKWDDSSKTHIKNWYYQWGRSVPMLCPSTYNSTSDHASYGALSFRIQRNNDGYYSQGIVQPTTFWGCSEASGSNYLWYGSSRSYYNLWDANCLATGTSDNLVVKTVYDPCPPGFSIPNGNTFTGFSASNGGSWSNGYTWNGAFFPAVGARERSSGTLSSNGSYGYYWTSAMESTVSAAALTVFEKEVDPLYGYFRSLGCSVRPVAEE